MKHHYVPQFLLRRWCNDGGKLQSYKIVNGRVACKAVAPEYTGYEHALYAIVANALGIGEDHLEQKFFSPIDSNAAVALAKIERQEVISQDDKIAWAFFLSSLRMRQPDVLAHLRTEGMEKLRRSLAERDAALPSGWPSTERWLETHHPGMMEAHALTSWLPQMVCDDKMTERFETLNWWVLAFKPEAPKLLLSDLPIHWEGGVDTDKFFIQMPIAPDRIFFGTAGTETEAKLLNVPSAELIRRVNRAALASASNRIWGADAHEGRAFIETNLDVIGSNVEPFGLFAERHIA